MVDTKQKLHVLILEDRVADTELMVHQLQKAGFDLAWERVETERAYVDRLNSELDVILADYTLPQFDALHALHILQEKGLDVPFIVVTGSVSEEVAVECMKQGAADYLLKDRLTRLGPAVKQALAAKRIRDERKRTSDALRESEERYRNVVERANDGIILLRDFRIIYANPRFAEMMGEPADQIVGTRFSRYVDPGEMRKVTQQYVGRMNGDPVPSIYETILRRKDGKRIYVEFNAGLITHQGTPTDLLLVRDVTERKHLEEQIQQQERMAAIGRLAGGIAHDFNNFLTSIMLYAQLLAGRADLPNDARAQAETILGEAQGATRLVQQILDFSRRAPIEKERIDLRLFIKEVSDILERTLPENNHLRLDVGQEPYTVNADPTRIQQVVMNLAVNARDAMPEGGDLHIVLSRLELGPDDSPPLKGMPPGNWVSLTVEDTGTGIPPDVLPHIFEPFYTTKEPGKGTGLGLAQVYGIVKQHNAHIDVDTEMGRGTKVTVLFPAADEEHEETREVEEELPTGQGETILLVEDEKRVREAISEILSSLNYTVLAAADGEEALALSTPDRDIDLIITDLIMPEMGGERLIQELNARSPVKALAVTGYVMQEDLDTLQREGIVDLIQKPFEIQDLAEKVYNALHQKQNSEARSSERNSQ